MAAGQLINHRANIILWGRMQSSTEILPKELAEKAAAVEIAQFFNVLEYLMFNF